MHMVKFLNDTFAQQLQETSIGVVLISFFGFFLVILVFSIVSGRDISFLGISVNRSKDTKGKYQEILRKLDKMEDMMRQMDSLFKDFEIGDIPKESRDELERLKQEILIDRENEASWTRIANWLEDKKNQKYIIKGVKKCIKDKADYRIITPSQVKAIEKSLFEFFDQLITCIKEVYDIDFEKEGPMKSYLEKIELKNLSPTLYGELINEALQFVKAEYGGQKSWKLGKNELSEFEKIMAYCSSFISKYLK